MKTIVVVSVLALASVTFAGCLEGDSQAQDFDPVAAPEWVAGQSWTYEVSASGFLPFEGSIDDSTEVTVRVLNTEQAFDGQPVYYVRSDEILPHPLMFSEPLQVLRQGDLSLVASEYVNHAISAPPPAPVISEWSTSGGAGAWSWASPCKAALRPVAEAAQVQVAPFPLVHGKTWSGSFGDGELDAFQFFGTIGGMERVETTAGSFDAVRLTYTYRLSPEAQAHLAEDEEIEFRFEQWYAPAIGFFAKSEATFTYSAPGGKVSLSSTVDLVSYEAGDGAQESVPAVRERAQAPAAVSLHSSIGGAFNVADGPVTATLRLVDGAWADLDEEAEPTQETVPLADVDLDAYKVRWSVQSLVDGGHHLEFAPDPRSAELTLGEPGWYDVSARLEPVYCGDPQGGSGHQSLEAFWEKTYLVEVEAGLGQQYELDTVHINEGASMATFAWQLERALPAVYNDEPMDDGEPVVYGPGGESWDIDAGENEATFDPHAHGDYALKWQALGPAQSLGPVAGDDVTVTLRVNYASPVDYVGEPIAVYE